MGLHEYIRGQDLDFYITKENIPFYSVVHCAMRMADSNNLDKLRIAFPDTWRELQRRYNVPGGVLPEEE